MDRQDETPSPPTLRLTRRRHHVVMDNGLVRVTISRPSGTVTKINYMGNRNILDTPRPETQRGYWDLVWSKPGQPEANFLKLISKDFKVIAKNKNQMELSFKNTYDPSLDPNGTDLPLNMDKRFVMLRGVAGFYTYAIYERLEGWPAMNIIQTRLNFKLDGTRFNYMAISDDKQRFMPSAEDLRRGKRLAYKEAVLLTNPSNPALNGEVDDKYQYSLNNEENRVHGWISTKKRDNAPGWVCSSGHEGFWIIMPSYEFKTGGPLKQELTSHTGPTCLADFHSQHYAGINSNGLKFEDGEAWKKVFGPVFIYLNRELDNVDPYLLWEDAKDQALKEIRKWPYDFPMTPDFPPADQRVTIIGRLHISDRCLKIRDFPAKSAYVGLAAPGAPGSWQKEAKGYQFWTRTDNHGKFTIKNVRAGHYSLYAWFYTSLNCTRRNVFDLGELIFIPPRNGPTIWEIGIPDRTAAEFYVPDPDLRFVNPLYINHTEKHRQYGLWDRYTDLYPREDLVYIVGHSNYQRDWFFAHVNRRIANNVYVATTWQISFSMDEVISTANYTLRLALASASMAELQVRVNDESRSVPDFTTGLIGRDSAIARHGIYGLHWVFSIEIPGNRLLLGNNTIFLKQARGGYVFGGVMYDYLRLEGPTNATSKNG
ncbi:OLC1v1011607C1 [Oldenlandia corymbosa var. corymbosa]|uniref:OLC1v1011607C1 n=1 Tax=Oldenlandia corymbosa var. corymbosa TaxID=529605 RepID=A0AAV1DX75_OLDCO|nr:OLC1v1011607C1 [Oldenlandia corymbosa var. corymbosa]